MQSANTTAVITGGGNGIGKAIALGLGRRGVSIAVVDLDLDSAGTVASEIVTEKGSAAAFAADISDQRQVADLMESVAKRFGGIDFLVNNAGIFKFASAAKMPDQEWRRVIDVNLTGQFLCCQAAFPHLLRRGGGKIVFIGSTSAHCGVPGQAAYAAAKAGTLNLSRVLGVEWARHGITVNSVSPGSTVTPMVDQYAGNPDFDRPRIAAIPLHRMNSPEDIANAVLFLLSKESDNITGQEIIVDGGLTALSACAAVAMATTSGDGLTASQEKQR